MRLRGLATIAFLVIVILKSGCGGGVSSPSAPPTPPAQSISIAVASSSISVIQGGMSNALTVSVTGSSGFSGGVSINIQGLPQGVATSPALPFSINAGSSQQITFSVATSVSASNFPLTISGTSGPLLASQTVTLSVQSFSISVSPSTSQTSPATITMNSSGALVTVTASPVNGFSGNVNFSLSNLPAGVSVTPVTFTLAAGQFQQVTLSANANASISSFQASLVGAVGPLSLSSNVFGVVVLPPNSAVISTAGGRVAVSDCQRKVEMSALLPSRNVLFEDFRQG